MSLAASIFTKLSNVASATSALIGSGSSCRLYPGQAPAQVALPYVVTTAISSQAEVTHDESNDFDQIDVQFTIIAATYLGALAIRKAIRADLADVALAGGEKAVDFTDRDGFSDGVDAHAMILDVTFWHNPSS